MSGPKNKLVCQQDRDRLIEALRAAGARVRDDDPAHALSSLWSCVERRRDADEDLDGLRDAMEDNMAA